MREWRRISNPARQINAESLPINQHSKCVSCLPLQRSTRKWLLKRSIRARRHSSCLFFEKVDDRHNPTELLCASAFNFGPPRLKNILVEGSVFTLKTWIKVGLDRIRSELVYPCTTCNRLKQKVAQV